MKTSKRAKAFIVRKEGYTPYVYNDPNGDATAGPGILLHRGPYTQAEARRYGTRNNPKISKDQYYAMLENALIPRERAVRRLVNVPLNQCEFDALVSLVYNIGEGNFSSSTVRRKLNQDKRFQAGAAFMMWVSGNNGPLPGLVIRRREERRIFRGKAKHWPACGSRVKV